MPDILPMFGKHFSSMYNGSMVGSGAVVFAVMGYVIANYQLDKEVGAQVRLNPVLLATILGEPVKEVEKAIKFLCDPDPVSTTKVEGGRRLIPIGEFDYRVVNGAKYTAIRNVEEARDAARERKRVERMKKGKPLTGEDLAVEKLRNGDVAGFDKDSEPVSKDRLSEQGGIMQAVLSDNPDGKVAWKTIKDPISEKEFDCQLAESTVLAQTVADLKDQP